MCEKCNKGKYYITTAIAYASGKPHIGINTEKIYFLISFTDIINLFPHFHLLFLFNKYVQG